ncbi:SGNH/GDSL hydrolase family protein [Pelomyxa schiedti]|nr:SGNH/GDSL hydrolase family protein [Pelomyxa schiedti]
MLVRWSVLFVVVVCGVAGASVSDYDVSWASPSSDSRGAMPIGAGDVSAGVWVDGASGDLLISVAKSDAFNENAALAKVGLLRVAFTGQPLLATPFLQALRLESGSIEISAGGMSILIFVDSEYQAIRVSAVSASGPIDVVVTFEPWRTTLSPEDAVHCVTQYVGPDTIVPLRGSDDDASVLWYHRNTFSIWEYDLNLQGLSSLIETLPDPLLGLTWGLAASAPGLDRADLYTLKGVGVENLDMTVVLYTVLDPSDTGIDSWENAIRALLSSVSSVAVDDMFSETSNWWAEFWDRSHIFISSTDGSTDPYNVTSKYIWTRFLDACDGRNSKSPIKFNGQAWVADEGRGLDYRDWGGGYWFQNIRQPYYAAIPSGDFDFMEPLYKMYNDALPLAKKTTETYFNHSGAFYHETITVFGTCVDGEYGYDACAQTYPPNNGASVWIRYHWIGGLEVSWILLDHYLMTGDEKILTKYLPFVEEILTFYDEHFPENDTNGKMVMFPSQSLETWQCGSIPVDSDKCVTNPTPDIGGLKAVLAALLALPSSLTTEAQRARWEAILDRVPDIPTGTRSLRTVIMPGAVIPRSSSNSENTELYTVYPFRVYASGKEEGLQVAINTFDTRRFPCNDGWCQDVVDAAFLGLTSEAKRLVVQRARQETPTGYRFGGFAQHYQDYQPSLDQYTTLRIALHAMILQPLDDNDGSVLLFPSWPSDWDVDVKLVAPRNTIVEAKCEGGVLTKFVVTPENRTAYVHPVSCV